MRLLDFWLEQPVAEAFDPIVNVPLIEPTALVASGSAAVGSV
jgi:hypothetical protein